MPKRRVVDHKKLIKMVQDGAPQSDIMKKFSYGTSTQLKVAYANALMATGQVPGIIGSRGGKKEGKGKQIKVGKRGSIIIPADVVSELGIEADAQFTARKTRAGIALKNA